jgi:hypothetical protein
VSSAKIETKSDLIRLNPTKKIMKQTQSPKPKVQGPRSKVQAEPPQSSLLKATKAC